MGPLCLLLNNSSPCPTFRGISSSPRFLKLPPLHASLNPEPLFTTPLLSTTPSDSSAPTLPSATFMPRNHPPSTSTTDSLVGLSLTSVPRSWTFYPTSASAVSLLPSLMSLPLPPLRESYIASLDPTLLSLLISATPMTLPLHLQTEIGRDLTLPMAMDLLCHQTIPPDPPPSTSRMPHSAICLLLLPELLEPLWRIDLPLPGLPPPSPHPQTKHALSYSHPLLPSLSQTTGMLLLWQPHPL